MLRAMKEARGPSLGTPASGCRATALTRRQAVLAWRAALHDMSPTLAATFGVSRICAATMRAAITRKPGYPLDWVCAGCDDPTMIPR
jgi:hypothetical protein